jgi:hypothetical protein
MNTYSYKKLIANIKNLFEESDRSLLDVANKEKRNNKQLKAVLNKGHAPLWMPSIASFLKIFFAMLFFWVISHPRYVFEAVISPISSIFSNVYVYKQLASFFVKLFDFFPYFSIPNISGSFDPIAIHTGIGAVLIGLAFFVAQSLTDKNDSERSRVLLYKSWFFPLLMAEVMAFFFFIGETNILGFIPVCIIALWTMFSLGSVIDILVKEYKMEEAKKEVLLSVTKKNFIKILDREITQRIGNNFIYKKYENSGILNVSPFSFWGSKKDIVAIKSQKSGMILDIKLNKLEKLVSTLSRVINENIPTINAKDTNTSASRVKQEPICYLRPLLGHKIESGESLFEIKKEVASRIDIKRLAKISQDIFVIKKDDSEVEARLEISKLKDRCILAINNQQTGELEKIIRLYVELVNEFFKYFSLYHDGCFSSEQARQERGSFFDKLKSLDWLSKDIREIFERGINSEDINIIREVAYLPILLVQQAIESKDHLIFQEFIYFTRVLYEKAFELSKKGKTKEADIMFDRTWRYLKELSAYHLESRLKDEDYPVQDFKDYYIQIIKTFQELLKSSFDKKDLANFEKFLSVASGLFNRLDRSYLDSSDTDTEKVYDFLAGKRQEMFFGLASWILSVLKINKDSENKKFYDAVQNILPTKIEEFTEVFLQSHDFKTEDYWGWDSWEIRPDEDVHTINVLEKLEQFFVIKALSLLQSKNDVEIEIINLPHNRDLAFLAEGTRDAMKTIDDIEKNPDNWKFVLDDEAIKKCTALRDLLRKAHRQQEQDDSKMKRETNISKDKVEKFKKSFIENYTQSHPVKELLKGLNLYADKTTKRAGLEIRNLGINTLFDKAAFFGDDVSWHVHYGGIDEAFGFGRSMAHGENDQVLEGIGNKATEITRDNFESTLANIKTCNIVLIATNHAIWKFFERSNPNWIPKWHKEFPKELSNQMIEGVYKFQNKLIPVYQLFTPKAEHSDIYVLDKFKIGKFIQYSPLDEKDNPDLAYNAFLINVQEFLPNSDLIDEFIEKPPQWLLDAGKQDKQIEYLQERVLIHVFEKYKFQIHDKFCGYILHMDKDEE